MNRRGAALSGAVFTPAALSESLRQPQGAFAAAHGLGKAPGLFALGRAPFAASKRGDFLIFRIDESLFCGMIGAHSSSWGGVPPGASRHASDAKDAFTHTFVR